MLFNFLLFAFVTLVSKILLGMIAVWLLLPRDGRCCACDDETIPLTDPWGLHWLYVVLRVQRRWCAHCAEVHHAQRARALRIVVRCEEVPARAAEAR